MNDLESTTNIPGYAMKTLAGTVESPARRFRTLMLEAFFFACIPLLMLSGWRSSESGVIAIFLAAAPITSRVKRLLTENRDNIMAIRSKVPLTAMTTTREVNTLTVISVLGVFAGALVAFSAASAIYGAEGTSQRFSLVVEAAHLGTGGITERRFGSIGGLIFHNFSVLATVMLLGAVYRGFGVALVLVWNACTWGVVLTILTLRSIEASAVPGVLLGLLVFVAVIPHLILEALAYVLGGLAATYLSTALLKYKPSDPILRSAAGAAARLLGAAAAALVIAAVVEASLPSFVLRFVR